jgi:tRNA(Ile)-lysidine synthase
MSSTRSSGNLEQRVARYLSSRGVAPGARVLVAFSGGPDSRVLLEILVALGACYPLEVKAAYLDHGLRSAGERAAERQMVEKTCTLLGTPLIRAELPPGSLTARAARQRRSLEELAREERYRFLRHSLRSSGSDYLALGHNLDDHLETLVMRFFQGCSVRGLRGIPQTRGSILRPLRNTTRSEIQLWLKGRGLEYHEDSTNRDPRFLRNAVRYRLLPVAVEIFPGYRSALARMSRMMSETSMILRTEVRRRLRWRPEGEGFSIECENFFRAPQILKVESLYELIDRWGPDFGRVPERFFEVLKKVDVTHRRRVLLAGHGLMLRRRGSRLFLGRDVVGDGKKGYFIPVYVGASITVPRAGLVFSLSAQRDRIRAEGKPQGRFIRAAGRDPAGADSTPSGTTASGNLPPSFVFRSMQAGDGIRMRTGSKQIRKLFGEWNIPFSERWKIPVVDSRSGVLAVLGKSLGYRDRFRYGLSDEIRALLIASVETIQGPSQAEFD